MEGDLGVQVRMGGRTLGDASREGLLRPRFWASQMCKAATRLASRILGFSLGTIAFQTILRLVG